VGNQNHRASAFSLPGDVEKVLKVPGGDKGDFFALKVPPMSVATRMSLTKSVTVHWVTTPVLPQPTEL
jgi:hypothetical protein